MSIPKLQHYVPQFLLKNFCSEGEKKIFVFDKEREETFSTNIKNVAVEQGFYNIEADNVVLSIEPGLSKVESSAAEIVAKVIETQSLKTLTERERYQLSLFAALQFTRVKQARIRYKQFDEAIKSAIEARGQNPSNVDGYYPFNDVAIKYLSIVNLAKNVKEFAPYFLDKAWLLFKATTRVKHYISDNPVTLHNQHDYRPYGNLGLAVKGIEIYFPLNSEYSLGMICQTHAEKIRQDWSQYLVAKRRAKRSPPLEIEESKVSRLRGLKQGLETGRAILSIEENVIFKNSLQVMQSSRFVYSVDGNFDLVRQMLIERPQFKEPPKIEMV